MNCILKKELRFLFMWVTFHFFKWLPGAFVLFGLSLEVYPAQVLHAYKQNK